MNAQFLKVESLRRIACSFKYLLTRSINFSENEVSCTLCG